MCIRDRDRLHICWSKTSEIPGWNVKLAPIYKGKEKPKEEADHSRLVGGRFNKQRNSHTKCVLSNHKMSRILHQPAVILKVYTEVLMGLSHAFSPDGLNKTLFSQGCILENDSGCGHCEHNIHVRTGEGVRRLCLGPACRSPCITSSWPLPTMF